MGKETCSPSWRLAPQLACIVRWLRRELAAGKFATAG